MRTDESVSADGYREQFVYDENCDCHQTCQGCPRL